jgi:hypothetical protein
MRAVPRPVIILLLLSVAGSLVCQANPPTEAGFPPMSKLWTDAEKSEFQGCLSRLAREGKERTPVVDAGLCEVWEEWKHWIRAHPEASRRKEDHAKFQTCNREHAAQVSGTPEQARAAFDICYCRAYGLPEPKQQP